MSLCGSLWPECSASVGATIVSSRLGTGDLGCQESDVCMEGAKKETRGAVLERGYLGSRLAESHPRLCFSGFHPIHSLASSSGKAGDQP